MRKHRALALKATDSDMATAHRGSALPHTPIAIRYLQLLKDARCRPDLEEAVVLILSSSEELEGSLGTPIMYAPGDVSESAIVALHQLPH